MRQFIALLSLLVLSLFSSPGFAFDCNAIVNDDGHVFSNASKVEAAARALQNSAAAARVVTYDALSEGKNLSQMIDAQRAACPSWQNGSRFKDNIFILAFAKPNHVSGRYGINLEPILGHGKWEDAAKPSLIPAITKFKSGDPTAMTSGVITTFASLDAMLSRPAGTTGAITVHEATDFGGLWKVLAAALCLIALAIGGILYLGRKKSDDERKAEQAETKRIRSICVSGINDINSSRQVMLFEAAASNNPLIVPLVDQYKELAALGLATLSRFDDAAGGDPNDAVLPGSVYASNRARYTNIIKSYVEPAKDLARQINAGCPDAPKTAPVPPAAPTQPVYRQDPPETRQPDPWHSQASQAQSYDDTTWNRPTYPSRSGFGQSYQDPIPYPQSNPVEGALLGGMAGVVIGEELSRHESRSDDSSYWHGRADAAQERLDHEDDRRDDSRNTTSSRSSGADAQDSGDDMDVDTTAASMDDGGDFDAPDPSDNGGGFDDN